MQQIRIENHNSSGHALDALTLTQQVARHWARRTFSDLSGTEVELVKQRLLDTLAAGVAGVDTEEAKAVRHGMLAIHGQAIGTAGAVLWGTNLFLPAPQAALVNGTAAHARELDDFDGCGHTGAVVVSAVAAVAQACHADGSTVLTSVAAGYDLAGRMLNAAGGYRLHNGLGWHSTATCGTFGAALAASRVLQLDAERTAHALGIAGSYMGGVWAFMNDGAMTKRMHPGKAAETGVAAAYLAQAGMTGPSYILESEWGGFFATYCGPHAQPERLLEQLGESNAIALTGIKPYACCRASHGAIDALLHLRAEHGFTKLPSELASLVLAFTKDPLMILAIINVLLLFLGCFMETTAILLIVTPTLLPIILAVGIDPVHFGIVMSVNLIIGAITPPFGVILFILKDIAGVTFGALVRALLPFYIPLGLTLLLITYWPGFVLFVPRFFKG